MIELKITSNNGDELRIVAEALQELAKVADAEKDKRANIVARFRQDESKQTPDSQEKEVIQSTSLGDVSETVDADGYPWDKRIHSTAQSRNQNDTWKVLRRPKSFGDDNDKWLAFIEQTRSELRGEDPEAPKENPAEVFTNVTNTPVVEPATENPSPVDVDFPTLMKLITSNQEKIPVSKVNELCTTYGLKDLSSLSDNTSYIPIVYQHVEKLIQEVG